MIKIEKLEGGMWCKNTPEHQKALQALGYNPHGNKWGDHKYIQLSLTIDNKLFLYDGMSASDAGKEIVLTDIGWCVASEEQHTFLSILLAEDDLYNAYIVNFDEEWALSSEIYASSPILGAFDITEAGDVEWMKWVKFNNKLISLKESGVIVENDMHWLYEDAINNLLSAYDGILSDDDGVVDFNNLDTSYKPKEELYEDIFEGNSETILMVGYTG